MSNMDKDKILKALKDKVYYAELPSMMNMSIMGSTLYIKLDRDGVIQNMQNDASAFEGWIFCLKAFFPYINVVIIDWEDPSFYMVRRQLFLGGCGRKQKSRDYMF